MELFFDYVSEVHILAVVFAAAAAFATGAVWYSKPLFGAQWQKAVGLSDKQLKNANMGQIMGVSFVGTMVSALAMALLVDALVLTDALQGALLGIMVAAGLLGANKLMQVQFERRSTQYWLISLGADALAFAVMGAILAVWR